MAQQTTPLKQHRSSLYLLAACVVALGLMFLLTIAKDLRSRQALAVQLADATRQADTRKLLAPLLAELQDSSETFDPEAAVGDGASPPPADVSADNYENIIGGIIRQCGLEQVSLTPDLQSILSDTGSLRVNLTARGAFPDFNRLMLALARRPFLSGIEAFHVGKSADAGTLEMFLQLRLAVSGEGVHEHQ